MGLKDYEPKPEDPEERYLESPNGEDPQYKQVSLSFPRPGTVDYEVEGEEKTVPRNCIPYTREEYRRMYWSLLYMRDIYGAPEALNKVTGHFIIAVYEMEVNNNLQPMARLFWSLIGKELSSHETRDMMDTDYTHTSED